MKQKTLTLTPETTLQELLQQVPADCRARKDLDALVLKSTGAPLDWNVFALAQAVGRRDEVDSIVPLHTVDATGRTVLTYRCVKLSGGLDLMRGMPRALELEEQRYVGKRVERQCVQYVQRTAELRVLHSRLKQGQLVRANDPFSTKIDTEEPNVLAHLDKLLK